MCVTPRSSALGTARTINASHQRFSPMPSRWECPHPPPSPFPKNTELGYGRYIDGVSMGVDFDQLPLFSLISCRCQPLSCLNLPHVLCAKRPIALSPIYVFPTPSCSCVHVRIFGYSVWAPVVMHVSLFFIYSLWFGYLPAGRVASQLSSGLAESRTFETRSWERSIFVLV